MKGKGRGECTGCSGKGEERGIGLLWSTSIRISLIEMDFVCSRKAHEEVVKCMISVAVKTFS